MMRYLLDTKIIGATAIASDLILVTDNVKHFKNFERLKIENWSK